MMGERARPRLLLLSSFRHGAGKSTFAANLAALAVSAGQRVGLVDACFAAPALHLFFGLNGQIRMNSFQDFLAGRQSLEQAVLDVTSRLGLAGEGRLFLLPASLRMEDRLASLYFCFDLAQLAQGLQTLSHELELDLLVIDCPAGISESNLSLLALTDLALVVQHANPLDFQGTAVLVDVARRLEVPDIQLVLNDVVASYDMKDAKKRAAAALGCPVAAIIPHDENLLASGRVGLYALQPSVRCSQPWLDLISACLHQEGNSQTGCDEITG